MPVVDGGRGERLVWCCCRLSSPLRTKAAKRKGESRQNGVESTPGKGQLSRRGGSDHLLKVELDKMKLIPEAVEVKLWWYV